MKKYCFTLDLRDDAEKIKHYEEHHKNVWPEILESIKESGIVNLEIFRWQARLFMIMLVNDDFSFERKKIADEQNEKVQEWEQLMWD